MVHHSRGLRLAIAKETDLTGTDASGLIESLAQGEFACDQLSAADQEMLSYSVKLTRSPDEIEKVDTERLREFGFDDRSIHDIACIVSYFAFVNRIADGLGVELET